MSGALLTKRSVIASESQKAASARSKTPQKKRSNRACAERLSSKATSQAQSRKAYRRSYHLKNRERENARNLARYHKKYKLDSAWTKKRKASWIRYAKKKGIQWSRDRGKRYRKKYSELSPSTRSKIRAAYRVWAKKNWGRRVEYARVYRRRNPVFGFRGKIASARRTGDVRKLAEECFNAIVRAYGQGDGKKRDSGNR